ncbi:hypothetical protein ABF359_01660 [Acinetobacter baumannii]|nr:hypothetical protein [Acinetobacter baumannii]MDH2513125.1 hypothetical protein [Acinetobacter baumannii]
MNNNIQAATCLNQICFQRLISSDFAQKLTLKSRIIRWVKGGAK